VPTVTKVSSDLLFSLKLFPDWRVCSYKSAIKHISNNDHDVSLLFINKCRYSSVCVVTRMWAGRLDSKGCFSGRGKKPSLFQSVETSFGAHLSSYSVRILGCLHGCKAVREWDWPQSLTRKAVCVYRNNEAHSHNHCWRGEAIIIECYYCVCLIYSACKAHAPHYIVICSCLAVPFWHIIS